MTEDEFPRRPAEARIPPFHRGATMLGDEWELWLGRSRDPTAIGDGVLCVRLETGLVGEPLASLRLTADEARALAAALGEWAGFLDRLAAPVGGA